MTTDASFPTFINGLVIKGTGTGGGARGWLNNAIVFDNGTGRRAALASTKMTSLNPADAAVPRIQVWDVDSGSAGAYLSTKSPVRYAWASAANPLGNDVTTVDWCLLGTVMNMAAPIAVKYYGVGAGQSYLEFYGYNSDTISAGLKGMGTIAVTASSRALKDDIAPLADVGDLFDAVQPVTFVYKKEFSNDGRKRYGFIAEDVRDAGVPIMESPETGEAKDLHDRDLLGILWAQVKELKEESAALKAEVAELRQQVDGCCGA